jgi:hypothetical protein
MDNPQDTDMTKSLTFVATTLAASVALALPAFAAGAKSGKPAQPQVQEAPLRAHLAFLSSDLLEGRGTGQRGGDLTVAYLENQAMAAGLKPANGNSYRQLVKIAGVKTDPAASNLRLDVNGTALPASFGKDWVYAPGDAQAAHSFNADLVFVGYGISASEEGWDDYKGQDVKGKVIVMMVNDPMPTADVLRPLDVQVRGSPAPRRGGRAADPHRCVRVLRL